MTHSTKYQSILAASLLFASFTTLEAQVSNSGSYDAPVTVVSQPPCFNWGQFLIDREEAISKHLDNQLKSARYFFEKQRVNLQGKIDLEKQSVELKQTKLAAYEARCEAGLRYQEARLENQLALQTKTEAAKKLAVVQVDLGKRLSWPVALRHPTLQGNREKLENAVQRLTCYTATGSSNDVLEVQQLTAALYDQLRALRTQQEILFEDLVTAKKFLNGINAAADNFAATPVARLASNP
jgi:hypothetical protein